MNKTLFQEYPPEQRQQMLEDNAEAVETVQYEKTITQEELFELKEKLSELSVKLNRLEEEKRKYNDYYKGEMKPLQKTVSEIIPILEKQSKFVEEECYKFVDEENGQTLYYNSNGELAKFRSMYPSEKQSNIFRIKNNDNNEEEKTGTNN